MIAISKLATLIPFTSLALAVPLTGLSTNQTGDVSQCKPNFQGKAVSAFIADTNSTVQGQVLEWSTQNYEGSSAYLRSESAEESFETGDLFVEPTGQPDGTYFIKLTANTDLVATASHTGSDFTFETIGLNDIDQEFDLSCNICTETSLATECLVSSRSTGECVTIDFASGHYYGLNGTRLVLGPCTGAVRFSFIPPLGAEDMTAFNMDSLKN